MGYEKEGQIGTISSLFGYCQSLWMVTPGTAISLKPVSVKTRDHPRKESSKTVLRLPHSHTCDIGVQFHMLLYFSLTPPFNQPTKQNATQTLRLVTDPDAAVQRQAFAILRNPTQTLPRARKGSRWCYRNGLKVLDVCLLLRGVSVCSR